MSSLVKQIVVLVLAVVGVLDGIYGWEFLGHLTTEVITVIVTLALAAIGISEMRSQPSPPTKGKT